MSQIIKAPVGPPAEAPIMQIKGSPITAAADQVQMNTNVQTAAVQNLGGKMAGGGNVEVKNIPMVPSAGNSNPAGVFAGMQELKATAMEQGKYDDMGHERAMSVGGQRRKRRSRKHKKNVRHSNKHSRKHRGSSRKHSSVHHSRRRVHFNSGKKTHKK
jgi:hypothetical protein